MGQPCSGFIVASLLAAGLSSASFAATSLPPGAQPCFTNSIPAGYGSLGLVKSASFLQTGPGNPTEVTSPAAQLAADLRSPSAYVISNAILANTRGFSLNLPYQSSGSSSATTNFASEAGLLAATPAGTWNTSFQLVFPNGDSFVGFSVFALSSNSAPVPQIANFAAAQTIDASAPFNLQWTPWIGASTNDRISLVIVDASGKTIVSAATDCSGQSDLPTGATGFTIAAGQLAPGTQYTGYLTFGASQLADRDDGALLVQRGFHSRSTRFALNTSGSGGTGQPGTLSNPTVTSTNLLFTLTGKPGTIYAIQGSADLATWTEEGRVTLPANGSTVVAVALPAPGTQRFYRAVSVGTGGGGGGGGTGSPASLAIAALSPTRMRITVFGAVGSTHSVQATTNFVTWTEVGKVTIPEDATNVVFTILVPAGSVSSVYRARSDEETTPPTPSGKRPTMTASVSGAGLVLALTGGDANRTYAVQQANAGLSSWSPTTVTITTGANGSGQATVSPLAADSSGIYRVEAK